MQTSGNRDGMKDFWIVYDSHRDQISSDLRALMVKKPEWASILQAIPPDRQAELERRSRELQRRAILEGEWQSYLEDLNTQGAQYARLGVNFQMWYEVVSAMRERMVPYLQAEYGSTPTRFAAAIVGMDNFVDQAMAVIGQSYIDMKEELIRHQQVALRELSTPVLPLRDGLLILPIIGYVDTQRARQFTEDLLRAVRTNRAKAVVIDITGVQAVDTKVANHLAQTAEAVRLMGATAIFTGLSSDIAQTLATLGIDLGKLQTVGDLQSGLEAAERLLGYKLVTAQS